MKMMIAQVGKDITQLTGFDLLLLFLFKGKCTKLPPTPPPIYIVDVTNFPKHCQKEEVGAHHACQPKQQSLCWRVIMAQAYRP